VIPAGTLVRLRTTNGGDTIGRLAAPYRETYGVTMAYPGVPGACWYVEPGRIKSVEPRDCPLKDWASCPNSRAGEQETSCNSRN
jgi:hypothetical protein